MIQASGPEIIDLGQVKQGSIPTGTFSITNKFPKDISIIDIKAGCGCTIPEGKLGILKHGESTVIKFSFNTSGRINAQMKSINISYMLEGVRYIFTKQFKAYIII